jgi:hypothetical protein
LFFLGSLVYVKNYRGGFASRLIYVLSRKQGVNAQKFQNGGMSDAEKEAKRANRLRLVEDLASIHQMLGSMTADDEFKKAWEDWWVESETKRKKYDSEKLQSLMVRQNLHMLKTSMILSACESDERVMRKRHWDKALSLVEPAMGNIPSTFREARAQQIDRGQIKNLPHAIYNILEKSPHLNCEEVKSHLTFGGATLRDVEAMLHSMVVSGRLAIEGSKFVVLGDPNNNF